MVYFSPCVLRLARNQKIPWAGQLPCSIAQEGRRRGKPRCEQTWFAGRGWGKTPSHGAGQGQRGPAWPRPQAPLHRHDLHTPVLPVDVFPDF